MRIIYNKDNFILYIFNNKEIEIDEILIEKYVKEAFLRIKKGIGRGYLVFMMFLFIIMKKLE